MEQLETLSPTSATNNCLTKAQTSSSDAPNFQPQNHGATSCLTNWAGLGTIVIETTNAMCTFTLRLSNNSYVW